jgi:hypothetical protein
MGSAADALSDLTGVKPVAPPTQAQKLDLQPTDTGSAANALRSLYGIEQPTTFADRFAPAEERPLERVESNAIPQKVGVYGQILSDVLNVHAGAQQGTTPNPQYYKKTLSSDIYENDSGDMTFKDASGKFVTVDPSKHVVLLDPTDARPKVYERSKDTDEGFLTSAGRLVGQGMATGAPVSRASQAVRAAGESVVDASSRLSSTGAPVVVPRAISSDSPIAQEAGAIVRNVPIANAPLTKAAETTLSQLGEKSGEVAGKYGSAASADAAGNTAKESIKDWITKSSRANESKLYDRVDSLINPNVRGTLNKTEAISNTINAERDAAALGDSGAVKQVQAAIDRGGLTYDGVKKLRTTIGEQLDSGILPDGVSKGELKRIYGSLTDDLKSTVEASGNQSALEAFNRANTYSRLANERRESLAKIVGSHGDAPAEAVFDKIKTMAGSSARADISKLAQARKVMGSSDWNEVGSTIVSKLGRDVEGNFSPRRFLTDYGKISDAGKNVLFRSGGKSTLADSLDDIATISSRFKELEKYANPSGTSRSMMGGLIGAGGFASVKAALATGSMVEPLTMLSTVLGGRMLASYLASPAGASSIAKWSRANLLLNQAPTPARLAAFETASRNLISTTGANASVPDFLKALQSPSASRANENEVPGKPGQ